MKHLHDICKLSSSGSLQYYVQLLIGSIICGTGFITNSETTVIGSMLISPIGGLIMKFGKEGFKRKEKIKIHSKGQLMEYKLLAMFVVPIVIGFLCGILFQQPDGTDVVEGRGKTLVQDPNLLIASAVIAGAAGILFNWGDKITMVGIGIATALLPPLVAVGYALGKEVKGDKQVSLGINDSMASAGLFGINFMALYLSVILFQREC
tara:strand:+ start:1954 stop:2574 length:621 start_codon:yes stop_codon:yes gene_type:complete